jgi:hypothetical protein
MFWAYMLGFTGGMGLGSLLEMAKCRNKCDHINETCRYYKLKLAEGSAEGSSSTITSSASISDFNSKSSS